MTKRQATEVSPMTPNDAGEKAADPGDGAGVYELPDVERMLKVSGPTLRKAIRSGTVPAPLRLGRRIVFPKAVFDAFLAGGAVRTAARVGNGEAVRTAALRVGGPG